MNIQKFKPARWGKTSADGKVKIPIRCPECKSKRTVLATYNGGERFIECNGCYQVIAQVTRRGGLI